MKQILVSWSSAYDYLMHFDGVFKTEFWDWEYNKSFLSTGFEKNHWGTALNICYSLALLSENAILLSAVGDDFSLPKIIRERINTKYLHKQIDMKTASSVIISDSEDTKITSFYPGAMSHGSDSKISYVSEEISWAIVSANHTDTMLEHARHLYKKWVSFFVDPAQQVSAMNKEDLRELIDLGYGLIANSHEYQEILEKTGYTHQEIVEQCTYVIITQWAQWSQVFINEESADIPALQVEDFEDSTGAGDTYRAWLLYWLTEWHDIITSAKIGSVIASYCVMSRWSQHHHFSLSWVMEDLKQHFDIEIDLFAKRKY